MVPGRYVSSCMGSTEHIRATQHSGGTLKHRLARAATVAAATVGLVCGGVAAATPAMAHTGASGVVAVHGGSGFSQYQEIVVGKSTTHWLATAPAWEIAAYLAGVAKAHAGAPRWMSVAVAPAAGAYAVSTGIRIQQAENAGECFSLVKIPYTWTYWPAKTPQGCR